MANNGKKLLITGGCGLIGDALIAKLQPNYSITVLDLKYPKRLYPDVNYITGDIIDIDQYGIEPFSGIIHLAALSRVINAEFDPLTTWVTNVEGTQKVLNFAHKLSENGNKPWIIYGSSREVYGEPKYFPVPENHPIIPINRYGVSKHAAEQLINHYGKYHGTAAVNLRFSNVYGSVNDHLDRVIPKFLLKCIKNETLEIHGADNTFDFTHISDTINGILRTMEKIEEQPNIVDQFNICTGVSTSLQKLAELCIAVSTGSSSKITETAKRSYDVCHYHGDIIKSKNVINYESKITLREGLQQFNKLLIHMLKGERVIE